MKKPEGVVLSVEYGILGLRFLTVTDTVTNISSSGRYRYGLILNFVFLHLLSSYVAFK